MILSIIFKPLNMERACGNKTTHLIGSWVMMRSMLPKPETSPIKCPRPDCGYEWQRRATSKTAVMCPRCRRMFPRAVAPNPAVDPGAGYNEAVRVLEVL